MYQPKVRQTIEAKTHSTRQTKPAAAAVATMAASTMATKTEEIANNDTRLKWH